MQQVHALQESTLSRSLGKGEDALFKSMEGKCHPKQYNSSHLHQMMPCPQLNCWQMVGWQTGEQCCQQECESLHWRTWVWQSCLSSQPQGDNLSVVRYPEWKSEWFGKREAWQWEGRTEERNANRRRETLYWTSRLCHLIERQYSLIYQNLSFTKSEAFIQINYSSTHCWALLAVRLSCSSMQGCLKKAELMLHFICWLSMEEIQICACAIFLLGLDRGCYSQAWRIRMWKVSSLADGLYFAHILPRKNPPRIKWSKSIARHWQMVF